MRKRVHGGLLFTMGLSVVLMVGCGKKGGDTPSSGGMKGMGSMFTSGAIPVKVDTVKIEPISTYILTNTTLEAQRQVDIIARVSGIVEKFFFEEGATVHKGNVIVKLDDRELRLNVAQAKAKLENTRSLFERSRDMFEKNLISKEVYDDAEFQYQTAKSQYENAILQLEYASIRAPLSGVITRRMVEIGDYVTTNQVVYSMADYDILLARIYVPEKEIGKIKPGQKAKIEVEAYPGQSFEGTVKMINPVIDPASGTVKVTVEIRRGKTGLIPGMFASVYILTDTHERAKVIPKKALILESESDRIFLYENGEARQRDVKVGFSDGDRIEVLQGVEPGDLIITVGQEGLRDGAKVRIIGAPRVESKLVSLKEKKEVPGPEGRQYSPGQKQSSDFHMDSERLKRMEERLLQNPQIKKAFEERAKADPDFASNPEKKMAFFREIFQKMRR